ncbi:MAG: DUF3486 family protein [Salinisphaeraceae bacterium]
MGRRSSIKGLPPAVKTAIDQSISQDRLSLDQIIDRIRDEYGDEHAPSRSALHRYRQNVEQQMQAIREGREIADVWAQRLGDAPESDIGKVVLEILRTLAYKSGADLLDDEGNVAPKDLSHLARAMRYIEDAGRLSLQREKEVRQAALAEAAESAETVARSAGMSSSSAAELRRKILMGESA